MLRELGDRADAERSFALARDLAHATGDPANEAMALTGLGALANDVSDYAVQKELCEASVAIWRELGDRRGLARAVHNLAWAEAGLSNVAAATALLQEALGHARAAGDDRWIARALCSLGDMLSCKVSWRRPAVPGGRAWLWRATGRDRPRWPCVRPASDADADAR